MSLPQFTPQMLHALAQPPVNQPQASLLPAAHHPQQQQLSTTAQAAAAISAYLTGAAAIVFPSQQAAQDYQAAALAGAGGAGSGGGGREGLAWRQARAIEALLVQSGQASGGWPISTGSSSTAPWDPQPQPFFQQQQQLYTQPSYSFAMSYPLLQQPMQPQQQQFAHGPSPLATQPPVAAASSAGRHSLLSDGSPAFSARSPPVSVHSSFSSGESSASSPPLSVASLSSSAAAHQHQPAIYSSSAASTVDPFELAPSAAAAVGEGLGFKEIFGFSPAVAFGSSFAGGGPEPLPPQVQQQSYTECVRTSSYFFDPPGPDDLPLPSPTLRSSPAQPYHFNALPAESPSYPPSPQTSVSTEAASASVASQPTQANLAAAAAAHFAWNQSVNLRDPKKRHVCPVCARGFARAFNLKSHMATHDQNRPKPFTCPHEGCERGFSRSHDLERHRVGIHQGQSACPPADAFLARYAHAHASAPLPARVDVGEDLGLALSTSLPSSGSSSSGSSTASNSTTAAQDSMLAASKAKKRAIRGVASDAY